MRRKEKGSITDKDLTLEVPAQDWPYLCNQNHHLYKDERQRAKDLAVKMSNKQKEYIFREQEYRRTFEEIMREIDKRS